MFYSKGACDFVALLRLRAGDLDYGSRILQRLSVRPPNGRKPRQVRLISPHDLANCFVLSNDEGWRSLFSKCSACLPFWDQVNRFLAFSNSPRHWKCKPGTNRKMLKTR